MLTLWQAALLGAVQGITEFLPISSSGHLVVIQQIFNWNPGNGIIVAFDVALHLGTLFAVLIYFRRDIIEMLTGKNFKMVGYLILATIPAVIVGFTLKDKIEEMFSSVVVVGIAWLITGSFLWLTKYVSDSKYSDVGWFRGFIIGCAQALAITPGISRSGSTIVAGMFLKLDKTLAARFAFLLAIPAIAGGAILHINDINNFPKDGMPALIVGFIVSGIIGYLSISWLLRIIQHGRFQWFGVYCWLAGLATLAWVLLK